MEIENVPLDSVRINGGTQSRAELSQSTIGEYAESIRLAIELPPVVVFFDGAHFWLADGFHRFHAHREAGAMEIRAEVRTGTQRDAVLYSVGANASHGLRRSNEDKRKAVETLLADPEWATWSNNAIAKACAVSDKTVAAYRAEYLRNSEDSPATPDVRTVERNGTTYEQNISKIGKAPPAAPAGADTPPSISPTMTPAAAPAPSLVQQVHDQQAAADEAMAAAGGDLEEPAPEPDPFDQLLADFRALELERDELLVKNAALEQHVALLTKDDLAAQVDGLVKRADEAELKFEQLSGRNRQLQQTARDAQLAKADQDRFLAKIRAMLGVESSSEILPAITARRAA